MPMGTCGICYIHTDQILPIYCKSVPFISVNMVLYCSNTHLFDMYIHVA